MIERKIGAMTLTVPSDREIVLTRVFDSPRRLVFEAMTKPEHVARWWGPRGTSVPVCEMDLRPGGAWRRVMRLPDGKEWGFRGVHREIVPPERVVFTEIFEQFPDNESLVTWTFVEKDGKTTFTARILYSSVELHDQVIRFGMEGTAAGYDQLAELLATMA